MKDILIIAYFGIFGLFYIWGFFNERANEWGLYLGIFFVVGSIIVLIIHLTEKRKLKKTTAMNETPIEASKNRLICPCCNNEIEFSELEKNQCEGKNFQYTCPKCEQLISLSWWTISIFLGGILLFFSSILIWVVFDLEGMENLLTTIIGVGSFFCSFVCFEKYVGLKRVKG